MTHVSRKNLKSNEEKIYKEALITLLSNTSAKQLEQVLPILATKTEITMLYKRLAIIYLLSQNYSIEEISTLAKTTNQTIIRIKYQLKDTPKEDIQIIYKKINSWKNITQLKMLVKSTLNTRLPSKLVKKTFNLP